MIKKKNQTQILKDWGVSWGKIPILTVGNRKYITTNSFFFFKKKSILEPWNKVSKCQWCRCIRESMAL